MLDETLYSSLISNNSSNNGNNCGNKYSVDSDDKNDNKNRNENNNNHKRGNNNNNDTNINKIILEQIEIYNHTAVTIKSLNANLSKIDFDDLKILGTSCLLNSSLKDFISPIIKISKLFMDDRIKISQRWVFLMYT
jgi:hypothetical protein